MPTTTIFLSYLTNRAPRRDRGCPQGVPTRHGPESPAGTIAGFRGDVHSRPTRREGETWGSGLAPPRAGSVKDGGATAARGPAVTAPGARAPPPGRPVSAPGPKWSRGCVQVGRVLCRKVEMERGVRSPRKRVGTGSAGPAAVGRETRLQGRRGAAQSPQPPWPCHLRARE